MKGILMTSNDIYTGSAAQEFVQNTNKTIKKINRRKAIGRAMELSGKFMTASAVVLGAVAAVKIIRENHSED